MQAMLSATRARPGAPRDTVDWKADPDWGWPSAAEGSPDQLHTLWEDAMARSSSLVAEAR